MLGRVVLVLLVIVSLFAAASSSGLSKALFELVGFVSVAILLIQYVRRREGGR
ncbi:hypothetical protein [Aliagarivorans taiwanensis]|uniref:hypothetical protein n=1 Tax=Aliagarivorans taiwanensis TaxID=561966 RepID=UPI0004296D4B|nr:hypothetical protein [Aliagarivorans taiwanensis]